MTGLLERRLLFVAGKGGVGRTTTSAALAIAAAREGKRVLLAMCNAKDRLSLMLETAPVGPRNAPIMPAIDAVNMTPEAALREYGEIVFRVKAVARAVFESRFVLAFLRGTPGLAAWSMLGKAYYHATGTVSEGTPRYDLVIVDGPATGHAIDMLRVPKVLVEIAPPGLLRREAERAWALLHDEQRAGIVLVTLPEESPVQETLDLHATLTGELGLPIAALVVNGIYPPLFRDMDRIALAELTEPAQNYTDAVGALLIASRARAVREELQRRNRERLESALRCSAVRLPFLFAPELRRMHVESLANEFAAKV